MLAGGPRGGLGRARRAAAAASFSAALPSSSSLDGGVKEADSSSSSSDDDEADRTRAIDDADEAILEAALDRKFIFLISS